MPITVKACCCPEDICCDCNLAATAYVLCEGGVIACPQELIIGFAPLGCDDRPDPNPGPADGTQACYTYVQGATVTVSIPYYLECGGKTYEFQWWTTDDCLTNPEQYDWRPYTGTSTYGCNFNNIVEVEFCDPLAGDCDIIIDAKYKEILEPACDQCDCLCLGCYYGASSDPLCPVDPIPPGCIPPCEFA